METWEDEICHIKARKGTLLDVVGYGCKTEYLVLGNEYVVALVHTPGCTLRGVSICGKKDKFDEKIGKKIAFINAIDKKPPVTCFSINWWNHINNEAKYVRKCYGVC
jgi:hypothetical protein